ncbi:MAG: proton-conducting transporter membrane subunit [Myxococcota bacterium]
MNPRSALLLGVSGAAAAIPWMPGFEHAQAWLGDAALLDATSRLFLVLVNTVFFGIAAHVVNAAVHHDDGDHLVERLVTHGLPFLVACDVAIVAASPVVGWAGLEASTLFVAPLVAAGHRERMWGSFQYFVFSSVGLSIALLGFACLEHAGGGAEFTWTGLARAPLGGPWVEVGLFLVLGGYGAKLGLFPLNTWLPLAYATAPGPVAALLGAVQFNAALVAVVRVVITFHPVAPAFVEGWFVGVGLASMAVSTLGIVVTRDYLRLLGYGSINHAGVIAVGLGLGAPAAYGVLVYVVSNAFIKAILFLAAGRVYTVFRTSDATKVRGLVKLLPYNGLMLMVGTFALLGLPPFGSFLGELLILSAVVESGWVELLLPFCLLLVVSFVAIGRTLFPMIWGEPDPEARYAREKLNVAVPKLMFLGALVLLGLYVPAPVNDVLRSVASALGGR